jgi:hypothetical protein
MVESSRRHFDLEDELRASQATRFMLPRYYSTFGGGGINDWVNFLLSVIRTTLVPHPRRATPYTYTNW